MSIALIGGTGVENLELHDRKAISVDTPYGQVKLETGYLGDIEMIFLKRHGEKHAVPPHLINYRGNIWALKQLGVTSILATGAVGSISERYQPGGIVLVDQFLDFTKNRPVTFYDGQHKGVLHVDLSEPYCPWLRAVIAGAAQKMGLPIDRGGVYVCTEGPRFETPAEIKMYAMLGGDVVGMTGVPEVVLARELGMCYATIALITNAAAGISKKPLTHVEVIATMNMLSQTIAELIKNTCAAIDLRRDCNCSVGDREAGLF